MAESIHQTLHLFPFFFFFSFFFSIYGFGQPQSPYSQFQALLQIQQLLNYPPGLSSLNEATDFCNTQPNPSLTVVCYGENLTQLHINGESWFHPMPQNFSSDSLFSALSDIPSLKVLSLVSLGLWGPLPPSIARLSSLEILNISSNHFSGIIPEETSSLRSLQTLILDHNMFTGQVPGWLGELQLLAVLSMKNNSLSGSLPYALTKMQTVRVLALSMNQLSGEVPDLRDLTNLQVLDLGHNKLGPYFPSLHSRLLTLILRDNSFSFGIPPELSSYYQLQTLDISLNKFVGPFLMPLLSLPSLSYLDVAGNKFTGMLSVNTFCNAKLVFVDLSSNRLTGELPSCLSPSSNERVIKYAGNCLSHTGKKQHPYSFCHNEALAVNVMPRKQESKSSRRVVLVASLMGGILGGIAVCGLIFLATTKLYSRRTVKAPPARLILEKVTPANAIKMLSDARYISETRKLGALGIPPYRTFALDELREVTSNFNTSNLIGEGSCSKVYKGMLTDGTLVAIRSLKMRKRHGIQYYRQQIELISKLRHRHLVSAVGHCFKCYPDDSGVITIFLVFEFVPNGTLRGCISEGLLGQKFSWTRRIAAAIGVARGLQFLHTGIVPGVYSNNLKITDILLDHDLHAKISHYNVPLLAEEREENGDGASSSEPKEQNRATHEDKNDVYDLGVILLEIIVGRAIMSRSSVDVAKDLLQVSLTTDEVARRSIVDPAIHKECSDDSLKTLMEICVRCLSSEPANRPSVEDVLWNLQFAAQVQESWKADSKSSTQGSPIMSPK